MPEPWLVERDQYAAFLLAQSQKSGNAADSMAWERYTLHTATMQTVAAAIRDGLPAEYRVAHGRRISYQGRPIYLEHLVTGPTGIYLIESVDPRDPQWLEDLNANLAFFRGVLGSAAPHFTCLVIQQQPLQEKLPAGANAVDSVETALSVIQQPGMGVAMPPFAPELVWQAVDRLAVSSVPMIERRKARVGKLGLIIVLASLVLNSACTVSIFGLDIGPWVLGLFMVVLPVWLMVWALQFVRRDRLRKGLMYTLLGFIGLMTLIMILAGFIEA